MQRKVNPVFAALRSVCAKSSLCTGASLIGRPARGPRLNGFYLTTCDRFCAGRIHVVSWIRSFYDVLAYRQR